MNNIHSFKTHATTFFKFILEGSVELKSIHHSLGHLIINEPIFFEDIEHRFLAYTSNGSILMRRSSSYWPAVQDVNVTITWDDQQIIIMESGTSYGINPSTNRSGSGEHMYIESRKGHEMTPCTFMTLDQEINLESYFGGHYTSRTYLNLPRLITLYVGVNYSQYENITCEGWQTANDTFVIKLSDQEISFSCLKNSSGELYMYVVEGPLNHQSIYLLKVVNVSVVPRHAE